MKYYVVWPDGQKFGPADVDVLNQWVGEGRLTRDTELESVESGARFRAGDLPGLLFPAVAAAPEAGPVVGAPAAPSAGTTPTQTQPESPYAAPTWGTTPHGSPTTPYQSPYQDPPQVQYGGDDGSKDVTYSFVFSIIGFFCCCFLTIFGAYKGYQASQKGHPNGKAALITAVVLLVLHITINVVYLIVMWPAMMAEMATGATKL